MVFKFTIDRLVNRYIPANQVSRLPRPIAWILGTHPVRPQPDYIIWVEILLGSFCGMALLEGVFKSHTALTKFHPPMIIASYGASAILCFNASQVPLAQPRNVFMGHFLGSLIGLCIQKLFSLSEGARDNYWALGALLVAVASVLMLIFNCVHPPAGASALLPSIDDRIRAMLWWYLPIQIILSLLIISVALITGNVVRRYPVYWWLPEPTGTAYKLLLLLLLAQPPPPPPPPEKVVELPPLLLDPEKADEAVVITGDTIDIPASLDLDDVELDFLHTIQNKLNHHRNLTSSA